uniref:Uncharacterized protein n=1 Tax=Klebsiella pneumoniae TaxID=573 RepID=A0A6G8FBV6_KLEPN|nr:hypothetical protein [Klebsiella pneumoniae]
MKLRFLDQAVRSSLRSGTPQPDLAASVTVSFKEIRLFRVSVSE